MEHICVMCWGQTVPEQRWYSGRHTCLSCGEREARRVRHTIAPLNKSNYIVVSDRETLKQLNPKRTDK